MCQATAGWNNPCLTGAAVAPSTFYSSLAPCCLDHLRIHINWCALIWSLRRCDTYVQDACWAYLRWRSCSRKRRSWPTPMRARSAFSRRRSSRCSSSVTSRSSLSLRASRKCSLLRKMASFALPTRPDGTDLQQQSSGIVQTCGHIVLEHPTSTIAGQNSSKETQQYRMLVLPNVHV